MHWAAERVGKFSATNPAHQPCHRGSAPTKSIPRRLKGGDPGRGQAQGEEEGGQEGSSGAPSVLDPTMGLPVQPGLFAGPGAEMCPSPHVGYCVYDWGLHGKA